jgi:flagellar biogenesis protein FliO
MPSGQLIRTFAGPLVVIGLLILFVWALRRGLLRTGPFAPRTGIVVETAVALGERRSLAIVAVEGRRLLLGLSPAGITLLADLARVKSDGNAS